MWPGTAVRPSRHWQIRCFLLAIRAILGLLENAVDSETTLKVPVQPGDRLVIYTDGFTESFNSQQEMLGVEGLKNIVGDAAGMPLPMMKQQIIDRVTAW